METTKKPRRRLWLTIGILVCMASPLGIPTLFMLYGALWPALSYTFRSVPAQIISASYGEAGEGSFRSFPKLTFEYQVDGKRYTSSTVGYRVLEREWVMKSQDEARSYLKARPGGAAITAWVSPIWPQRAVLETGFEGRDLFWMLLLLSCNSTFVLIAVSVLRQSPEQERAPWLIHEEFSGGYLLKMRPANFFQFYFLFLALLSFSAFFAVVAFEGEWPGSSLMLTIWGVLPFSALALAFISVSLGESAIYLQADSQRRTLIVPGPNGLGYAQLSMEEVEAVELRHDMVSSPSLDTSSDSPATHLQLILREVALPVRITTFAGHALEEGSYGNTARWLAQRLSKPMRFTPIEKLWDEFIAEA